VVEKDEEDGEAAGEVEARHVAETRLRGTRLRGIGLWVTGRSGS
jgi:hypothetical protein